jgi:hypothetical protein
MANPKPTTRKDKYHRQIERHRRQIQRHEHALDIAAHLVVLHGPIFMPLFFMVKYELAVKWVQFTALTAA